MKAEKEKKVEMVHEIETALSGVESQAGQSEHCREK